MASIGWRYGIAPPPGSSLNRWVLLAAFIGAGATKSHVPAGEPESLVGSQPARTGGPGDPANLANSEITFDRLRSPCYDEPLLRFLGKPYNERSRRRVFSISPQPTQPARG